MIYKLIKLHKLCKNKNIIKSIIVYIYIYIYIYIYLYLYLSNVFV